MEVDDVRKLALRLPGTIEKPHFELVGFRVADKGFIAVQPDGSKALVQVDDATAEAFIAEDPAVFGRLVRMGTPIGVEVALPAVDPAPHGRPRRRLLAPPRPPPPAEGARRRRVTTAR